MSTINKLAIEKPYYCSTSNYFSNEENQEFESMTDFLDEFKDADIDMNYMFRFDIKVSDEGKNYVEIFMILQRKGIFKPIVVNNISELEAKEFEKYAKKHWNYTQKLWKPFSNGLTK